MKKEKDKEWAEKVQEYRRSGQSQREWCRNNGEKRGTLRYWLERQEELSEGKEIRFSKLVLGGEHSVR